MRRSFVVLAASMVFGLVFFAPGRASATMPNCEAVGFQQACVLPVDLDFTDTVLCDFPVQVHVSGRETYRPFFAKDGSGDLTAAEEHDRFRATIVNPATGRSFTDTGFFNVRVTFLPDGSAFVRLTGLFHNVRVDDGRRLFHQSGNHSILFGPDGGLIDEVFHGNFQSEPAFPGKICPILAQPL